MQPSVFKICNLGKGCLYIMPKPSSEWLADDAACYKDIGITQVISLLENNEQHELGLAAEDKVLANHNIKFCRFAIVDRSIPSRLLAEEVVGFIAGALKAGEHVAVHCRAGIGRSGLICSCVLIRHGWQYDQAIAQVSAVRGIDIPDTTEQVTFIHDFAGQ